MATTNLLHVQNEPPSKDGISLQKQLSNSPDVDAAVNLHRLSFSNNRAQIISVASNEYRDSDEEIYRDNESDDSSEQRNDTYNKVQSGVTYNVSYSRLKDYAEISMEEQDKINRYWKQLLLYITYNSFRFLFIGIIILIVNVRHQNEILSFKNGNDNTACCLCYNYAKFQNPTYRIDWSMCYESCDHCKSCQNIDSSNDECQIPHRMDITMDDDQCPEKLSISSFGYFKKNYIVYGVGALACVILYIIFMIISALVNKENKSTSSTVIFIFVNVQISLICAYCITKPFQYYLETYQYGTIQFECYKDSLNEDIENILTLLVDCAVAFVALPFLLCCCRCIAFRKDSYNIRKVYAIIMKFILIVAVIGCILGTIALTWISFKVAAKHNNENSNRNIFHNATVLVITVDIIMALSVFDVCIFCGFCRDKIHTIYMVRYSPYMTQKDWELTVSDNISTINAN